MEKVNAMALAHVSGGSYFGYWNTAYKSNLSPAASAGSAVFGGSGKSLPPWNVKPGPNNPGLLPVDPNDKDDDQAGLG